MKVYVCSEWAYDDETIVGVYSSLEKALKAFGSPDGVDREFDHHGGTVFHKKSDRQAFYGQRIVVFELDK